MRRSHRHWSALALVIPFLMVGCDSNPTDVHEEELTVELSLSSEHVHILSPLGFTAVVKDAHGAVITDMDTLRVERKAVGSDTWRTAADLELVGTEYVGEYTFTSSGQYELRVMGVRTGHMAMEEMTMASAMAAIEAVPAHAEAGGYRVEFESFPGHIHEGDVVDFKFWIMEVDRDPTTNERAPITGIQAEIKCLDGDGTTESHAATEAVAGEYGAAHTFLGAGDASAEISFTGTDGQPATASFHFHVVHGH